MNGRTLAAINAWLTLTSNDTYRHEWTITTLDEVVHNLSRWHATDDIIARTDVEIRTFKHGTITPWKFSQTLRNLTLGAVACTTSRRWENSLSRALTLVSTVLCNIGGRIAKKLRSKILPTEPSTF